MSEPILTVSHMNAYYQTGAPLFRKADSRKQVLKDISFSIGRGEIIGLVGESGCGKSTLGKAVLHMVKDVEGEIVHFSERPQMVFQDPYSSLNPMKTVGWILREPLKMQGKLSEPAQREKVSDMLRKVGLDESYAKRYPRELSGGQRQRVCIAAALMLEPKLMIADEPVSALDVTIQAQIIRLLLSLNKELEVAILLISHDLKVIYQICSRVMVMKDGEIVEQGTDEEVYFHTRHPYTKELLRAAGIEECAAQNQS